MTDTSEVYWYGKAFRWLFAMLDKIVYGLISFVSEIFELVAGSEIRANDVVSNFFTRIQIILGVIILFKLAISFFSGIVDPDGFKDSKKGIGSVIKRVVIVLVMMLLIIPLNIPEGDTIDLDKNESYINGQETWNARMNESGILFGTMAELQSRLLKKKTITKLILGTGLDDDDDDDIALILLRNFIFINLKPGKDNANDESNWLCPAEKYDNSDDGDEEAKTASHILRNIEVSFEGYSDGEDEAICSNTVGYDEEKVRALEKEGWTITEFEENPNRQSWEEKKVLVCADPPKTLVTNSKKIRELKRETLLNSVNYKCDLDKVAGFGNERYIFVYKFFLSTVAGVLCLILLLSLTIDVAVRVFKLLVLRLISPVAILSYIDPKSEKTFNNWSKAVATTYLDLFIRIAIISFILMFISIIPKIEFSNYVSSDASTLTKLFARLIIIFGLFIFAKQAPKFITETLGIDSKESGGIFSGVGKILGATTLARGVVGSAVSDARVKHAERLADPKKAGHHIRNVGSSIISGITGGIGGAAAGGKALVTADKDYSDAVTNAQKKRTQLRASHSTGFGRWADRQSQLFTGQSLADKDTAALETYKDVFSKSKAVKEALESETKKHGRYGTIRIGNQDMNFNFERLLAAMNGADQNGNFNYIDEVDPKKKYALNVAQFDANTQNTLLESQIRNYQAGITRDGATAAKDNGIIINAQRELNHVVNKAGKKYQAAYNNNGSPGGYDNVKKIIGLSASDTTEFNTKQKHINHMANKQANNNK